MVKECKLGSKILLFCSHDLLEEYLCVGKAMKDRSVIAEVRVADLEEMLTQAQIVDTSTGTKPVCDLEARGNVWTVKVKVFWTVASKVVSADVSTEVIDCEQIVHRELLSSWKTFEKEVAEAHWDVHACSRSIVETLWCQGAEVSQKEALRRHPTVLQFLGTVIKDGSVGGMADITLAHAAGVNAVIVHEYAVVSS